MASILYLTDYYGLIEFFEYLRLDAVMGRPKADPLIKTVVRDIKVTFWGLKLLFWEERAVGIVPFPLRLIFENRPPRGSYI